MGRGNPEFTQNTKVSVCLKGSIQSHTICLLILFTSAIRLQRWKGGNSCSVDAMAGMSQPSNPTWALMQVIGQSRVSPTPQHIHKAHAKLITQRCLYLNLSQMQPSNRFVLHLFTSVASSTTRHREDPCFCTD